MTVSDDEFFGPANPRTEHKLLQQPINADAVQVPSQAVDNHTKNDSLEERRHSNAADIWQRKLSVEEAATSEHPATIQYSPNQSTINSSPNSAQRRSLSIDSGRSSVSIYKNEESIQADDDDARQSTLPSSPHDRYSSDEFEMPASDSTDHDQPIQGDIGMQAHKTPSSIKQSTTVKKQKTKVLIKKKKVESKQQQQSETSEQQGKENSEKQLKKKPKRLKKQNEIEYLTTQLEHAMKENRVLKTIQNRQDRALVNLELKHTNLPEIIDKHNEEVRILREHLRLQREKTREQERVLRERNDQLQRTLLKVTRLEKSMRHHSTSVNTNTPHDGQNLVAEQQIKDGSKRIRELERQIELLSKNHRYEYHQIQIKHKQTRKQLDDLEREYNILKEKARQIQIRTYHIGSNKKNAPNLAMLKLAKSLNDVRNPMANKQTQTAQELTWQPQQKVKMRRASLPKPVPPLPIERLEVGSANTNTSASKADSGRETWKSQTSNRRQQKEKAPEMTAIINTDADKLNHMENAMQQIQPKPKNNDMQKQELIRKESNGKNGINAKLQDKLNAKTEATKKLNNNNSSNFDNKTKSGVSHSQSVTGKDEKEVKKMMTSQQPAKTVAKVNQEDIAYQLVSTSAVRDNKNADIPIEKAEDRLPVVENISAIKSARHQLNDLLSTAEQQSAKVPLEKQATFDIEIINENAAKGLSRKSTAETVKLDDHLQTGQPNDDRQSAASQQMDNNRISNKTFSASNDNHQQTTTTSVATKNAQLTKTATLSELHAGPDSLIPSYSRRDSIKFKQQLAANDPFAEFKKPNADQKAADFLDDLFGPKPKNRPGAAHIAKEANSLDAKDKRQSIIGDLFNNNKDDHVENKFERKQIAAVSPQKIARSPERKSSFDQLFPSLTKVDKKMSVESERNFKEKAVQQNLTTFSDAQGIGFVDV